MSRNIIFVLMYHRHELLNLTETYVERMLENRSNFPNKLWIVIHKEKQMLKDKWLYKMLCVRLCVCPI
jgi:hypothetical protein